LNCPESLAAGLARRLNSREPQESIMAAGGIPKNIAAMSFEDAMAELEQIVKRLEEGKIRLDEAIASFERGAALKNHCEAKLREAQTKVEKIVPGPDGAAGIEPFKID
jgi:exodeoxyribonuclease VII small subunit